MDSLFYNNEYTHFFLPSATHCSPEARLALLPHGVRVRPQPGRHMRTSEHCLFEMHPNYTQTWAKYLCAHAL